MPAPIEPPAIGMTSTIIRMVTAAVCQPEATSSPKKLSFAAASSVWKGCGSNSRAKALIRSASIASRPPSNTRPGVMSSK